MVHGQGYLKNQTTPENSAVLSNATIVFGAAVKPRPIVCKPVYSIELACNRLNSIRTIPEELKEQESNVNAKE